MEIRDQVRTAVQDEALKAVMPLRRAGIGASMGVGKTLIGLRHMNANYTDYCKFLVVGPKRSVLNEWKNEAVKHNMEHLLPHIDFTTYLSLNKQHNDYDIVYLDECHSLLLSHAEWLRNHEGKILGLTGTPPKFERSEKGRMVAEFCPISYTYVVDEAVGDSILNDYRIMVHTLPLDTRKNLLVDKGDRHWYTSETEMYNYWSKRLDNARNKKEQQIMSVMRMRALQDFTSKEILAKAMLDQSTEKTILFSNTQEQADRLCKHSYHSNNPESEETLQAFKNGEISKLSCVLQLNEGVNIPNLKVGIIMHAYGNERKLAQRIGRLLRLNPDETSTIHILCYSGTVDEKWVKNALENFDQAKITWNRK